MSLQAKYNLAEPIQCHTICYMPRPESHVSERKRTFSGESECDSLLDWLNSGDSTRGKAQVVEIIDSFHYLRTQERSQRESSSPRKSSRANTDGLWEGVNKLHRHLSKYAFHPFFIPTGSATEVHWIPLGRKKYMHMNKKVPLSWLVGGTAGVAGFMLNREFDYDATDAVFNLTRLAEQGLLDRLKRCRCGLWVFARFSHQRFCSSKCREQEFRSSTGWKEHRRKKAREYYRLHKTRNIK